MMAQAVPRANAPAWHALDVAAAASALESDADRGLSEAQAAARLARTGGNRLPADTGPSPFALIRRQFESPLVLVLLAALAAAAALGDVVDAAAIAAVVLLNATLGLIQEHRAERALAALRRLGSPAATVVRDGVRRAVPAEAVVPGDLVAVEAGDQVPADARLVSAIRLRVNEAPLTGESAPVHKRIDAVADDAPLADRRTMLYLGTHVAEGKGLALITGVGVGTELGRIASLIGRTRRAPTPLQERLARLGTLLLRVVLLVAAGVFVLGVSRGEPVTAMLLAAVTLAVAAIPEGLPTVVTIALAVGVSRMARRHALVRRLPAVETLGAATVICTDKTGTLTRGEMTVTDVVVGGRRLAVTGEGYTPAGRFEEGGQPVDPAAVPGVRTLLRAAVLASDAALLRAGDSWRIAGDPTEGAIVVAAAKAGLQRDALHAGSPRIWEVPFDAARRRMTVVCREADGPRAYVKGAFDVLLPRCATRLDGDGRERELAPADAVALTRVATELAGQARRVLAVATAPASAAPDSGNPIEGGLCWLGLVAMADEPRAEAAAAVAACRRAGIRTVMITGDHRDTAVAVARAVGIAEAGVVLTGADLDALGDDALARVVADVGVYARVSAEHKLRIVRAWSSHGAVVAMTGDGVNDAPALEAAMIGVAMGRTGTDVARGAADLVITDDNFASIAAAVAEGRRIYDNIRKALLYLVSSNLSEVIAMGVAMLAGLPLPFVPLQILWLNLVTDGLPALALGIEPAEPDVMHRPPRPRDEPLVDRARLLTAARHGLFMALGSLAVFVIALEGLGAGEVRARALAFTALVFSQLTQAFNARSERHSILTIGLWSNPTLLASVVAAAGLQWVLTVVPFTSTLFELPPLSGAEWALAAAAGLLPLVGREGEKAWGRSVHA